MSLYYYDSGSAAFVEISGSAISGTQTDDFQESGFFSAVTASIWKMMITSAYHTYQLYVCEVQFYGTTGVGPTAAPTVTYMPAVTPAPHPTVSPTGAADSLLIKMLKDTSYVDTGESTNLAQSITNVGLDSGLNQGMTSFTSGTLSTELNGFDCFVVPELERGNFYSALSSTDITALASWVSEGRVMVVSADSYGRAVSLLNGVFGWSLSLGSTSNGYTASITSAASGTAFEAGPSTLYGRNGNYALTSSSIPSDGSSIYT